MQTTGYHTCENSGTDRFILESAPFHSHSDMSFLGPGSYLWEDNLPSARWWGEVHYKKKYVIVKFEVIFKWDELFDLVGRMDHLNFFSDWIRRCKEETGKTLTISEAIIHLKKASQRIFGTQFPFKAIRAADFNSPKELVKFNKELEKQMNLTPVYIICILNRDYAPLHARKICHKT